MSDPPGSDQLASLVPHIFLPPQLPQEGQSEPAELATISLLCSRLIESAESYGELATATQKSLWSLVARMLRRVSDLVNTPLTAEGLQGALRELQIGDVLPLHIRAQNAAIIVRKDARGAIFEVFEASTANEAVYSTTGKLLIDFPGPAVHIPQEVFELESFQENAALFLSHMHAEVLDDAAAETTKAESTVVEVRDTINPRYITELFVGILHGCNGATNADVHRITKRVADEVMWNSAYKPWRRLPLWLVLRVALQTTIRDNAQYKGFMLFFTSSLLSSCVDRGFPSDVLHAMRAKVARRLAKLGDSCPEFLIDVVRRSIESTESLLQQRWQAVQLTQAKQAVWFPPSESALRASTRLSLDHARPYLTSVLRRNATAHTAPNSIPSHPPRFRGEHDFKAFSDGRLTSALSKDTPTLVLADFEASVRVSLSAWVNRNLYSSPQRTAACTSLHSCFEQYQQATGVHYSKHNPQDQSVAVLTLLSLWVGIDRLALAEHPTMSEFNPEIPITYLEPLVLSNEDDVRLARDVEQHIRARTSDARPHTISVFDASSDPFSMPLRLYEQDPRFSATKERIERDAHNVRETKEAELHRLNEQHRTLSQQAPSLAHEYVQQPANRRGGQVTNNIHAPGCARCSIERQIKVINFRGISVHEWPLPLNDNAAKLVVFELMCPQVYSLWREATYAVLTAVGSTETKGQRVSLHARLGSYTALSSYLTARPSHLMLGSKTKSFLDSHYKLISVPSPVSKVCVNNGLTFNLFDSKTNVWTATVPFSTSSVAKLCTPVIPTDSIYHHLQFAIEKTTHTSNQIMADQASCPKELGLHEHIAFASMRSGGRLQWLNLARELRARVLPLGASEVHHLIAQTIWQIGPLHGEQREWHVDLRDSVFCLAVLTELTVVLESVGDNWKEIWTVQTSVSVASRILGACNDAVARQEAILVLRKARAIAAAFRDKLQERLRHTEASSLDTVQRLVCETAATVTSTYDVLDEHISQLLHSPEDTFELVRSAILVRENAPSNTDLMPRHTQYLLRRHDRTLIKVEERLRRCIAANAAGLHRAIRSLWSIYRSDGDWSISVSPNERQLFRVLKLSETTQSVHLDLLNGLLLVDGKPLGRLPADITGHATFRRVFGQAILDVVPASDREMVYETRSAFHGYSVSFALRSDQDLVVRATPVGGDPDSSTLQLIPHSTFTEDLPHPLVEDCVHWADLESGHVEFRPLDSRWTQDADNWTLVGLRQGQPSLQRDHSDTHLVDLRSSTFTALRTCLATLELPQYIMATCDGQQLFAELPRFRLLFFMNEGRDLESVTFRDMVVDENQASHRTMFGLKNQLVLRAKDLDARTLPRSRRVIIPDGSVSFIRTSHHVQVNIGRRSDANQLAFHEFLVDDDLGCLTGASSMTARLFQTLLHAVTSSCLPDPLTGHTGTELALKNLDGAQMLSFRSLSPRDIELLDSIASLSPYRTFYPAHLRVMQQVEWTSLSPLSQHSGFKTAVSRIAAYARSLDIFHERAHSDDTLNREEPSAIMGEPHLDLRSIYRLSVLYPPDTPTCRQIVRIQDDLIHKARHPLDMQVHALAESKVATFSRSIQAPAASLSCSDLDIFGMLVNSDTVKTLDRLPLTYSPAWLRPDIGSNWLSLYRACIQYQDGPRGFNRHRLTFSLCTFVYANHDALPMAMLLAALALNAHLPSEPDPWANSTTPSLQFRNGFMPDGSVVVDHIRQYTRQLADSPAVRLGRRKKETLRAFEQRQVAQYQVQSDQAVTRLAAHFMSQWSTPNQGPIHFIGSAVEAWINNADSLRRSVKDYFQSCNDNTKFASHIQRVRTILRNTTGQPHQPAPLAILSPLLSPVTTETHSPFRSLISVLKHVAPPSFQATSFSPRELLLSTATQQPVLDHDRQSQSISVSGDVHGLLSSFGEVASDGVLRKYLLGLEESVKHWDLASHSSPTPTLDQPTLHALREGRDALQQHVQSRFEGLRRALLPSSLDDQQLELSGLWFRLTPTTLLHLLSQNQRGYVPRGWIRELMLYGRAFMAYQQSQRLLESFLRGKLDDVRKELESTALEEPGSVEDSPDWILIQSNFLARPLQRSIAREMISPASGQNSLLQLNMGEGKSSVIVPFTVAALADRQTLVRVIVLKALSNQMFDLLVDRVGGLARRRVFSFAFSRGVAVSPELVIKMKSLYNECIQAGGILVVQPEHILSFKLMGLDLLTSADSLRYIDGVADNERLSIARSLCELQQWVTHASRDVLDESDELLHARYQLIYTVGLQRSVEDHPYRWTTIMQALSVLKDCVAEIQHQFPNVISYHAESVSHFPHIRLLTSDADEVLTLWKRFHVKVKCFGHDFYFSRS